VPFGLERLLLLAPRFLGPANDVARAKVALVLQSIVEPGGAQREERVFALQCGKLGDLLERLEEAGDARLEDALTVWFVDVIDFDCFPGEAVPGGTRDRASFLELDQGILNPRENDQKVTASVEQ